jgi:secretion/DNA translocation related TadE-like protein
MSRSQPVREVTDRGSATLWVIAAIILVVAVATAGVARTRAVVGRHRAESAADLTALAAATGIGTTDPCRLGADVARANGASMIECVPRLAPDGRSGSVRVRVRCAMTLPVVGDRQAEATARAARERAT